MALAAPAAAENRLASAQVGSLPEQVGVGNAEGIAAPENAPGSEFRPADASGAGLAIALLPSNLAAIDAALDSLLRGLQDVKQTLDETVGGVGVAPWLVVLAGAVATYEVTRRNRGRVDRAGPANSWPLPEGIR
jgi:hypothetical protein